MVGKNINPEFRLKSTDQTRNSSLEEINQNESMSKKHKKGCTTLNYIEHFLILTSTTTRCISISPFSSLIVISIRIASSAIGLKICAIAAGIKKHKSIIKKKKKHDKIVMFTKSKLNSIEVLISKALIDSVIGHDDFFLINNVQKKYAQMTEEIKNL